MDRNLIVITGCDSGIGENCAAKLSALGYTVLISFLDKNVLSDHRNIIAQKMDLRIEKEIHQFSETIYTKLSQGYRLVCFIHNAGIASGGPAENIPLHIYREIMEVNYFGIVSLTRLIIPALIKCRSRLFFVSSLAGKVAAPFLSPYAASKFALEGYADSLRRELNPFGIKTVIFEPSGVITPIWKKWKEIDMSSFSPTYTKSLDAFKKNSVDKALLSMPCEQAADFITRKVSKRHLRTRYLVAKDRVTSLLLLHLPDRILDFLIRLVYRMDYGTTTD